MRAIRKLLVAALMAGVIGLAGALWSSPWVMLRTIEVSGNHHALTAEVVAASGLAPGARLSAVPPLRVQHRVEAVPWVRTARVERVLPSKVRINVMERVPAAMVTAAGVTYLADREGIILEEGSGPYPTIAGLPLEAPNEGERIGPSQFHEALRIVDSLAPSVRSRLRSVVAPTPNGITLELAEGLAVLYGPAELLEEKNYALVALIQSGLPATSIDVRVPSRPSVRLRT
ncbi:MAG: cell division protein FtsQ/DivIB [Actinomycetota bacterium]